MPRLPPAAYAEADYFQREKRNLFAREWLCFGAAGQLAAPGAFISHALGGWPIIALRGEDGTVRGFRNVCRHQQMPLVEQPAGRCTELRCRYHGWTYDLQGALIRTPDKYPPPEPMRQIGLQPIDLKEQAGLLFSRLEPGGTAAPPALAPDQRRFHAAVQTDVDANWKALAEVLLARAGHGLIWPNALVLDLGELRLVRQIVPRTFLRTRLIDLVFTADPLAPRAAAGLAARDKQAAEAVQAALARGEPMPDQPEADLFRRRVAAACADA
ncbi:MAG TPA: aromatic ring-hydroxylating dioxygenase subunit alpha [Candidatus Sulfotelmatobacter sp.]|nr:aromatic ring-hydroxylating dioxygenase subunit alpha [Candidatus Sulfotelmatobacter sp.]